MKNLRKVILNILLGIGIGCTIFVLSGIIAIKITGNPQIFATAEYGFIKQAVCNIIVALGFSLPSLVHDNKKLPLSLKTLIHIGIGFTVYGVVAVYAKWVPVAYGIPAVVASVLIAISIYFVIWSGFYFYYRYEAKKINEKIKKM